MNIWHKVGVYNREVDCWVNRHRLIHKRPAKCIKKSASAILRISKRCILDVISSEISESNDPHLFVYKQHQNHLVSIVKFEALFLADNTFLNTEYSTANNRLNLWASFQKDCRLSDHRKCYQRCPQIVNSLWSHKKRIKSVKGTFKCYQSTPS